MSDKNSFTSHFVELRSRLIKERKKNNVWNNWYS